jgi:hypothetical protein
MVRPGKRRRAARATEGAKLPVNIEVSTVGCSREIGGIWALGDKLLSFVSLYRRLTPIRFSEDGIACDGKGSCSGKCGHKRGFCLHEMKWTTFPLEK